MSVSLGSRLWEGLIAVLAATLDQTLEMPACFLMGGLLMRRELGEPFGAFDAGAAVVVAAAMWILVRRVVSSPVRPMSGWGKIPEKTVAPTVSWAHVVWGSAWLWLASVLWTLGDGSNPAEPQRHGLGPGFLLVGGGMLVLRSVVGVRRWVAGRER